MNRHERRKHKALTHKGQHFVPEGYLRAWCDPGKAAHETPYVWVFDRNGPTLEQPGKRKAPANIFKEKEMYTIKPPGDPDGRDLSLEYALNRIENDFCVVRRDFIELGRTLGERERAILVAFVACSRYRTPGHREHTRAQWMPVLSKARELENRVRAATPDERVRMARFNSLASRSDTPRMGIEQLQALVDRPLQTSLVSHVQATVPLLQKLTNLTVLCTDKTPGFITCDEPVVWFDPEAYKRPPPFQSPALMYKTIEITVPISPRRMLFLGRQNSGWPEFLNLDALDIDERLVDELNRRTCAFAREKIVVSRNEFRQVWTKTDELPSDACSAPYADGEYSA